MMKVIHHKRIRIWFIWKGRHTIIKKKTDQAVFLMCQTHHNYKLAMVIFMRQAKDRKAFPANEALEKRIWSFICL